MASVPVTHISAEHYLDLDSKSDVRNEYYQGQMHAIAGGSPRHAQLIFSVGLQLGPAVRLRGCTAYSSDLRVKAGHDFFYPDLTVICSPLQLSDDRQPCVTNPMLVIEILSPTTETFDRGRKFHAYRTIPTLQEYVLVAQSEAGVERYTRNVDGTWTYATAMGTEATIYLATLDATLSLAEIYRGVTFDEPITEH